MENLIKKRGVLKRKLTMFINYFDPLFNEFNNEGKLVEFALELLKHKMKNLESDFLEFDKIQSEIEMAATDAQLDGHLEAREDITSSYDKYISLANLVISKVMFEPKQEVTSNDATQGATESLSNVRLPTIDLPKFDGNLKQWLEYKNTYYSLIHTNNSINTIQKYHYLKASLVGDALKTIQTIDFTPANYNVAWDLLCNRYNNTRLLIHSHCKSLVDIELQHKETSQGLRQIIDIVLKNLKSLENLGQSVDNWDTLIIFLVCNKLDKRTFSEWEKLKSNSDFPTLNEFIEFLRHKASLLETIEINSKSLKQNGKRISMVATTGNCPVCDKIHSIYYCDTFLKQSVKDRFKTIKNLKLCINCLKPGHNIKSCKNSNTCRLCKQAHNTLLHFSKLSENNSNFEQVSNSSPVSNEIAHHASVNYAINDLQILLCTAVVYVEDVNNRLHKCRVLLDSGSQSNFISQNLLSKLKIPKISANINVTGINSISSKLNYKCNVNLSSKTSDFKVTLQCLVLPKINSNIPISNFSKQSIKIPTNLQLADPQFNISHEVDILLGAEIFWDLLIDGKIQLGKNKPVLQNTVFGWIISGSLRINSFNTVSCNFSEALAESLTKFWSLEEDSSSLLDSDQLDDQFFKNNHSRDMNGRFIVRVPLKGNSKNLGQSKNIALKRFKQLELKFKTNNSFRKQYCDFINEYIQLGHMSMLSNDEIALYYLPHHGVMKHDSITTKLRVVFDGSSKSSSGWSLNDIQHIGPKIQNNIFDILIRFRKYKIVVTSDIEKMYRQILIDPKDRPLHCILWREDEEKPIETFQLNTVTYGTASAPYLAMRCLREVAVQNSDRYPSASTKIIKDFYVDDLITGFDTVEEAIQTCQEIVTILKSACFPLRKWRSNCEELLNSLPNSESLSVLRLGEKETIKTLGVVWLPSNDSFSYQIKHSNVPITKRTILSDIATIFDPLGLVSPCIILAKITMQKLWKLKLGWDEYLPQDIVKSWSQIKHELPELNNLRITRSTFIEDYSNSELHGFCDASNQAYGACVYVNSIDRLGSVKIILLCSKTKVAPVKTQTIPRLELCGAFLLAKLMDSVVQAIGLNCKSYYWCDSQIALAWIKTHPSKLNVFIANRVEKIQHLSNVQNWKYVNTKSNPADLASRGLTPAKLLSSELWWTGPEWLHNYKMESDEINLPESEIPELKKANYYSVVEADNLYLFSKYSSLGKLKRIIAYCFRIINNVRLKQVNKPIITSQLSVDELEFSMRRLIKLAQQYSYCEEIKLLSGNKNLKLKHKLAPLSPFVDSDRILRVGGRLKYSHLNFSSKHPILLSGKHMLSKLIIEETHKKLLHCGPHLLLATVRQCYWITSGMSVVKQIVRNCITCIKAKPKLYTQIMADLPKARCVPSSPFTITGVDYAGPFIIKDRKGRGAKTSKAYLAIFVCFSTKAIHIEVVLDLTSEAFIATFRRFISRRGKPTTIYSDNGSNFIGAQKLISQFYEFLIEANNNISNYCVREDITSKFICPSSPNFGGL